MVILLEYIFWLSIFLIFFNYIGYTAVPFIFRIFEKKRPAFQIYQPTISFIVAAYNEAECIEEKILNSLSLDYPRNKIEFIFITDGSTDETPKIVAQYPLLRLLHSSNRKGKCDALNKAVAQAKNNILIFSDANALLNKEALKNIARHYQDSKVGGVAGEKKVLKTEKEEENVNSEGLYWKYESFLKKVDSGFSTVVGAAGELFSVRKFLYEHLEQNIILDDFMISMKIAQKGYQIRYEPDAYALELPSFSLKDEKKRKVRIAAGGFQAIKLLPGALQFWKHPRLTYLYVSHRVLRWVVTPLCLILSLLSSFLLTIFSGILLYKYLFLCQFAVYLLVLVEAMFPLGNRIGVIKIPYYFVFMNISVIQGFFRFLRKKQPSTWEKVKRSSSKLLDAT
jgi:poly-beta-1,6-N-acetyl-D-glucosamine synthase